MGVKLNGPYWGAALTAEYRIGLAENHQLGLDIAAGVSITSEQGVPLMVSYGMNYYYDRNYGVGMEIMAFTANPLRPNFTQSEVSFLLFPNVSYTDYNDKFYIRIAGGVLIPYSSTYVGAGNFDYDYINGGVVPGLNITIGRVFHSNSTRSYGR